MTATRKSAPANTSGTISWREMLAYFSLAAVIDTITGLRVFPAVMDGALVNPDSYMRLVRLRDILAQHAPLHAVARDGSGNGTVLHWSHLLDSILLLLAAPLSIAADQQTALHWAALALGPISSGFLAIAAAWAMAPFSDREWRWLGALLAAISPAIVGYALPGVVHHHVLVAVAAVMAAGWAIRAPAAGAAAGTMMGAWAAAGIWLTPESMPFILAAFGGLGIAWIVQSASRRSGEALRAAGTSFLLLIAAALAVDPPFAGAGAAEIDRLSIVYLALAAMVCLIGWAIWWIDGLDLLPRSRGIAGAAVALAGFAAWLAAFPTVLAGPAGLISADEARSMFGGIAEMRPVTRVNDACTFLMDGVLAALGAAALAAWTRSLLWSYAAACASLLVVLGLWHLRFSTYSATAAAAMLPVMLTVICRALAQRPARVMAAVRVPVIALFLLFPEAAHIGNVFSASEAAEASAPGCDVRTLGPLLAHHAGQVVLADVSETPALLYWTDVRTVGSLYHRNVAAFMRLRAAWRSGPSDDVPQAVAATGASLVLFCPQAPRSLLVADLPPETLFDRLSRGEVPRWLVRLGDDPASGYVLYGVANGGGANHG